MEYWFSEALIKWYKHNKRDLPWRAERDPYKIWLSEVILQQTQVVQGLSYYLRFTKKFPEVQSLAKASEDEVLKLWQGLGYYSRARNLHHAAKSVCSDHNGRFPDTYKGIRQLKGVGDYTAAAVASFAFDLPHAVVDGNVYRVLSRLFGIAEPIDSNTGKKTFSILAEQLLDKKNPALHNQSIMEFGSQHCKPVNPDCASCIFKNKCHAFANNAVGLFPKKSKKIKVRHRYFNYLLLHDKSGRILVNRRNAKDIWQGLYEFTLLETDRKPNDKQLVQLLKSAENNFGKIKLNLVSKEYTHILTHQKLHAKFYVAECVWANKKDKQLVTLKELKKLAWPRLIEKFLEDCDLKEIL